MREVCTTKYHLCSTDEMDKKIRNENMPQKFNVKTAGSSTTIVNEFEMKKLLKLSLV